MRGQNAYRATPLRNFQRMAASVPAIPNMAQTRMTHCLIRSPADCISGSLTGTARFEISSDRVPVIVAVRHISIRQNAKAETTHKTQIAMSGLARSSRLKVTAYRKDKRAKKPTQSILLLGSPITPILLAEERMFLPIHKYRNDIAGGNNSCITMRSETANC